MRPLRQDLVSAVPALTLGPGEARHRPPVDATARLTAPANPVARGPVGRADKQSGEMNGG